MSINEYREKIEEIKKFLLFAHECVDESLCRIDGDIDNVNGREMMLSRMDLLSASSRVKTAGKLISQAITAKIEIP